MLSQNSQNSSALETLLDKKLISTDQLSVISKLHHADSSKTMESYMVDVGFITEQTLTDIMSEKTGIEYNLKTAKLDHDIVQKVPESIAQKYNFIPISLEGSTLYVAMSDIYNIMILDTLKQYFPDSEKIIPIYAPDSDIDEAIEKYHGYDMSIVGILKEIEQLDSAKTNPEDESYLNPAVRLVDSIMLDGVKKGASDIHIEPDDMFVRLRYRLDGQLMQICTFHKNYWSSVLTRMKILAEMNITEIRSPQDGRIEINVSGRPVDFRVATQPTIHGENVVMRILDQGKSLVPISQLGFSEVTSSTLAKALKKPEGIIIVTGPTGSGKSTTLYSILQEINCIEKNIMTLENPVEYQLPMIRQSSIQEKYGFSTTDGIKSLMRQDPDIIFIGEIRDQDTATLALQAAMTGHQVFSTLHANDAVSAIQRLVNIGVAPDILGNSIICTTAQRLARKLCCNCKQEYTSTDEDCEILGIQNPTSLHCSVGCEECHHTGYKGRIGLCEILYIDSDISELIASNATHKTIFESALSKGFATMAHDGIRKVLDGITDISELIRTVDMTSKM